MVCSEVAKFISSVDNVCCIVSTIVSCGVANTVESSRLASSVSISVSSDCDMLMVSSWSSEKDTTV